MKQLLKLSFAAILSFGATVHAEPTGDLDEAGRAVFAEAVKAAEKKEWALCRTKAVGVWQQIKHPQVAGILGVCEAELGMHRDAAEHLNFFFVNQKEPTPTQKKLADEQFAKVRGKVALLTITPTPADAEVRVNGVLIGRGLQRVFVDPGDVSLSVTKSGQERTRRVDVKAGATESVAIEVPPAADAQKEGVGASGAGGNGAGGEGGTGAGGSGAATEEAPRPLWPALVLGGISLGGIGAGIGLSVASANAYSEAERTAGCEPFTETCREAATAALDDAAVLQNVGIGMFALGGAAAIGTIVYAALPTGGSNVALLPVITPNVLGLNATYSF